MTQPIAATVGRRVDWIELFFDLAMVALVTELSAELRGSPSPTQFLVFAAWSIPAWWAWSNVMVTINALPELPRAQSVLALILATGTVALMAIAVSGSTDRVWAFALANALLRCVLLAVWLFRAVREHHAVGRTLVYNGVTAALWFISIAVPAPWAFTIWAVAILIEVLMLRADTRSLARLVRVDIAHGSERLGLIMIILIGESLLSVVEGVREHWHLDSGIAAILGFIAIALIAWGFFVSSGNVIEEGLTRLAGRGDMAALLDTVMLIPYLIVAAIVMFSAGLATAIEAPDASLSLGASACLGGGLALFYLTNAVVILRYGSAFGEVLPWSIPAVALALSIALVAPLVHALVAVGAVALVVTAVILVSAALRRVAAHRADAERVAAA